MRVWTDGGDYLDYLRRKEVKPKTIEEQMVPHKGDFGVYTTQLLAELSLGYVPWKNGVLEMEARNVERKGALVTKADLYPLRALDWDDPERNDLNPGCRRWGGHSKALTEARMALSILAVAEMGADKDFDAWAVLYWLDLDRSKESSKHLHADTTTLIKRSLLYLSCQMRHLRDLEFLNGFSESYEKLKRISITQHNGSCWSDPVDSALYYEKNRMVQSLGFDLSLFLIPFLMEKKPDADLVALSKVAVKYGLERAYEGDKLKQAKADLLG